MQNCTGSRALPDHFSTALDLKFYSTAPHSGHCLAHAESTDIRHFNLIIVAGHHRKNRRQNGCRSGNDLGVSENNIVTNGFFQISSWRPRSRGKLGAPGCKIYPNFHRSNVQSRAPYSILVLNSGTPTSTKVQRCMSVWGMSPLSRSGSYLDGIGCIKTANNSRLLN